MQILQAFEAAARSASMTRAAQELCVTHGAVSRHVRELESLLGVDLFHRTGRQLLLTGEGRRLADDLQAALHAVDTALNGVLERRRSARTVLRVNADPELASPWLIPRLPRFQAEHPDLDLAIETSTEDPDFQRPDLDLSLRYAFAPWPRYACVKLYDDRVIAVCSPSLLAAHPGMTTADVARLPRLRYRRFSWAQWSQATGMAMDDPQEGPEFDSRALLIEAAAQGLGIGLTRSLIARDYLASGQLVEPFDISYPASYHCYAVCRADNPKAEAIQRLRDWLLAVAAEPAASAPRAKALPG